MRVLPWIAAAAIVFHSAIITVAAIPSPADFQGVKGERESTDDRVARSVRPALDSLVPLVGRVVGIAWRSASPLRPLASRYVATFGLGQSWRMFAQPPRTNNYLAVCGETSTKRRCLVVLPGVRPDRFKGPMAFEPGFRDKALSNSLEALIAIKARNPAAPFDEPTRYGADVLAPVARYFGATLQRQLGAPLVRDEVWYGIDPMTDRGDLPDGETDTRSWPDVVLAPGQVMGHVERTGSVRWMLMRLGPT